MNHNNRTGDYLQYSAGGDVVVYTDRYGYYTFNSLPQGYYTLEAKRNGYYNAYRDIVATTEASEQSLALTPMIYGEEAIRVVLEWGVNPSDLDSHMVGPKPGGGIFHTWYGDKDAYVNSNMVANLDLDDVDSYGPETTRVYDITDGTYTFYVHHYAGEECIATSGARVMLYDRSGLLDTYYAPTDQGSEIYWNVFSYTYNSSTRRGSVSRINTITSSPCVSDSGYSNGTYYDSSSDSADYSVNDSLYAAVTVKDPLSK